MFVGFFGSDSKVGTTQVAQSFARAVARNNPDDRVLFLMLTPQDDSTYLPRAKEAKGLDDVYLDVKKTILRDRIRKNMITRQQLEQEVAKIGLKLSDFADLNAIKGFDEKALVESCFNERNFYCMGGVKNFMSRSRTAFDRAYLEVILKAADKFDHVIADCGSDAEFGPAICFLAVNSDKNFFIGTMNKTTIIRMGKKDAFFSAASGLMPISYYLVNKLDEKKQGKLIEICKRLGLPDDRTKKVAFSPKGESAENERKLLYDVDKAFRRDIEDIAREVVGSSY